MSESAQYAAHAIRMLVIPHQPPIDLVAERVMTYLRMRNTRRTQPGLPRARPPAETTIEIEPAGKTPAEAPAHVASVTTKTRPSPADPAIAEGQGPGWTKRGGTLHKPVHAE